MPETTVDELVKMLQVLPPDIRRLPVRWLNDAGFTCSVSEVLTPPPKGEGQPGCVLLTFME